LFAVPLHLNQHFLIGLVTWLSLMQLDKSLPLKNSLAVVLFLFVYMIVNLYFTIQTGIPVYPPLSWKSMETLYFLIVSFLLSFSGFFLAFFIKKTYPQHFFGNYPIIKKL
jgi:hypothetical protein